MDVFISWSGERSRRAAEALHAWLPKVINALSPWLSVADIDKGSRWTTDVAGLLEKAKLGVICLTPGNLHSDWILFEAGALSKTLQSTYVCPLLFGLQPADVKGPLAQFQATQAIKEDVRKLLHTINSALGDQALTEIHLNEAFDVWWPKLDVQFQNLPTEEAPESPARPEREILEEILALVRSQARSLQGYRAAYGYGTLAGLGNASVYSGALPLKAEGPMIGEPIIDEPKLSSSDTSPAKESPARAESHETDDDLASEREGV